MVDLVTVKSYLDMVKRTSPLTNKPKNLICICTRTKIYLSKGCQSKDDFGNHGAIDDGLQHDEER